MAASRRSSRSRKQVSYSKFGENDDSDDDFESQLQPAKKIMKEKKVPLKKNSKKPEENTKLEDANFKLSKERLPVSERMFDKELEFAMEMSLAGSSTQITSVDNYQTADKCKQNKTEVDLPPEILVDIHKPASSQNQETNTKLKQLKTLAPEDVIETETTTNKVGRSRRKAAQTATSRQKQLLEKEEDGNNNGDDGVDFKPDDFDSEESDQEEDDVEDEDFSFSPKKKRRRGSGNKSVKKEVTKKPTAKRERKTPVKKVIDAENRSPSLMKREPAGVIGQSNVLSAITSKSCDPTSPNLPNSRQIKRKSIVLDTFNVSDSNGNNPLGGVRLVSPGQPFRLGLSRFARVKPLHANPKIT